jgi:hypothetical protein
MRGRVLVTVDARYAPFGFDADTEIKRQITDALFASPAQARAYAMRWKKSPGYKDVSVTFRQES